MTIPDALPPVPDAPRLAEWPTLEVALARYARAPLLYAVRLKLAQARLARAEARAEVTP